MKRLKLTQGKEAILDNPDYVRFSKYKWRAVKHGDRWYAATHQIAKGKTVYLHRVIMEATKGQEVDHQNRNGLDNRRANLRFCTHQQNSWNQRAKAKSRFKGVHWYEAIKKWKVEIRINGKKTYLGVFADPIKAARVYDDAAKKHYGEFARISGV